jgi:hypothetical protein
LNYFIGSKNNPDWNILKNAMKAKNPAFGPDFSIKNLDNLYRFFG